MVKAADATAEAAPREKAIVDKIMKFLKIEVPGCYAKKRHSDQFNPGDPDITGCLFGHRFEIEVKRPGNYPTELQRQELDRWKEAGAIVGIARSVDDVKAILKLNNFVTLAHGQSGWYRDEDIPA